MINVSKISAISYALFLLIGASLHVIAADTPCQSNPGSAQPCTIELPTDAIQKLKIEAGFGWGIFSGTIYNGNDDYHVTRLIVSMTPKHDDHHMHMHAHMSHEPKVHQINLDLPPATKGALSMALPDDVADAHDFDWEILQATGFKIP